MTGARSPLPRSYHVTLALYKVGDSQDLHDTKWAQVRQSSVTLRLGGLFRAQRSCLTLRGPLSRRSPPQEHTALHNRELPGKSLPGGGGGGGGGGGKKQARLHAAPRAQALTAFRPRPWPREDLQPYNKAWQRWGQLHGAQHRFCETVKASNVRVGPSPVCRRSR